VPLALALSPHLDDAAFSAGGALARLARTGWSVVVATLFTASVPHPRGFALACQTDKGLAPEVDYMALRRAEDVAACAVLGAIPRHLPLPEAPHRGYDDAAALFREPHAGDSIDHEAADAIAALLVELQPGLLLAPQAIGGHVDHVLTVRALQRLGPALPILWWRDFPYSIRTDTPRRPYEAFFAALPELALPAEECARHRACAAYVTQLSYQFGGAEGLARAMAAVGRTERMRAQHRLPPVVHGH
jgi:LmbE family N-acetylglucosaminyl deacetylase